MVLCAFFVALFAIPQRHKGFSQNQTIKLRKRNALRIALFTEKAFQQKPGYVHQSAVIAGLVHFEEDDKYSLPHFIGLVMMRLIC